MHIQTLFYKIRSLRFYYKVHLLCVHACVLHMCVYVGGVQPVQAHVGVIGGHQVSSSVVLHLSFFDKISH